MDLTHRNSLSPHWKADFTGEVYPQNNHLSQKSARPLPNIHALSPGAFMGYGITQKRVKTCNAMYPGCLMGMGQGCRGSLPPCVEDSWAPKKDRD